MEKKFKAIYELKNLNLGDVFYFKFDYRKKAVWFVSRFNHNRREILFSVTCKKVYANDSRDMDPSTKVVYLRSVSLTN